MAYVSPECLAIQCGAISQADAGMQSIMACASAGYAGVRSCMDPMCVGAARASYCPPMIPPAPVPPAIMEQVAYMESTPIPSAFIDVNSYAYEGMVECPSDKLGDFWDGLDTWHTGLTAVVDKLGFLGDLSLAEMAGLLAPVAVGGGVLLLFKKG